MEKPTIYQRLAVEDIIVPKDTNISYCLGDNRKWQSNRTRL